MKDAVEAATAFARAVAAGDAEAAHKMLSHQLAADVAAVELSTQFGALADAMGGVTGIGQAMVILEDWPGMSAEDRAMVYVPLEGDEFSEAVTLTISASDESLRISAIEWGRP